MNVYINTAKKGYNVMTILVAANNKDEAWNCITNRKDGDYYYFIYDYEKFKLVSGVVCDTEQPKIIMEHKCLNNNIPVV